MENFSRGGDRGGSRGSFRNGGGKGGFKGGFKGGWKGDTGGDRDARPVTMHSTICSTCKKTCEVPFRPTGEKPVYCRDCFAGRSAMGGDRSHREDVRVGKNNLYNSQSHSNFNSNIVPRNYEINEDLKKQIDSMNIKLDKLTNTIQNIAEKISSGDIKKVISTPIKIEEKIIVKSKIKDTVKKVLKKK